MKQLFKQEELIGKTIAQIILPKESYQDMWIKFTDNSFVTFDIEDISKPYGYEQKIIVISDLISDNSCEELVELKIISQEDYELSLKKDEEDYQKEVVERELQEKKRIEDYEKKQLEMLNKKYNK